MTAISSAYISGKYIINYGTFFMHFTGMSYHKSGACSIAHKTFQS